MPSATADAPSAAVAAAIELASKAWSRSMIAPRTAAVNVAVSGAWFSTATSTSWAAVAAAAASEAESGADGRPSRYGSYPPSIAFTAS
jgi:hypothetical protein